MFIHCSSRAYQSRTLGSLVYYMPYNNFVTEVKDLWYERRPGPTAAERRQAKAYHRKLPPSGEYSALCHAKYILKDKYIQDGFPEDAMPADMLYGRDNSTRTYIPIVRVAPPIGSSQNYEWIYYQYLGDGLVVLAECSGYAYWSGSQRKNRLLLQLRCVLDSTPSWGGRDMLHVAYASANSATYNCSEDDWEFSALMDRVREMWSTMIAHPDDPSKWSVSAGRYQPSDCNTDLSTIVRKAEAQLYSALRYNDLELVDYSVNPRGSSPWAYSNVDFLNGRAASYVDALDDIPRACDNQLQNIVAVLSMLEMIAFESNELFSKWCDAKFPKLNLSKQLRGDWYRTNRWGRSDLQVLYARFKSTTSKILDQTCIDEFLATKRDQFGELSSAWLQGRYVLTTSVSDLGQAWDYWYDQAAMWLGTRSASKKCHGSVELESGRFQCSMTVKEKALQGIVKFFELAYTHGMEPNAYVLWDLVPFSFVVDWFYPVGNAFEGYTKSTHYTPELWDYLPRYDGNAMCYSVSYVSRTASFGSINVYTRWYESSPPLVEPAYILRAEQSKARVLCPSSFCASQDVKNWDSDVSKRIEQRQKEFDRNARRTIDLIALF